MPKRKLEEEKINCDTLEWIVDILGTTSLLNSIINAPAIDVTLPEYTQFKPELRRQNPNLSDGIYFDGSHWYSIKNNIKKDSYSLGYQVKGTAHFCQTFAVMIYLDLTSSLKPGEYANNIVVAINFWLDIFIKYSDILNYVVNEIRTSEWQDTLLYGTQIRLKNVTNMQFLKFLELLKKYARDFVGCRQG